MIRRMHRSGGLSVVELVVAAAIIVSLVTVASGAWVLFFRVSRTSSDQTQASLLTEEAAETINLLRDKSWSTQIAPLTLDTPYYLYWNGTSYSTSTTPVIVNGSYTVSFALSAVGRDFNNNIVASGGTNDTHTRSVMITVTNATSSTIIMQAPLLIHDVFKN